MPREGVNNFMTNFNVIHEPGNRCSSEKSKICQNNKKNFDRNFVALNEFVDDGNFLQDLKMIEDDIKSKCWSHRKKSDVARERWKLLAKALLKPKRNFSKSVKDISVRRFTSFDLITPYKLGEYQEAFRTDYWVSQERKFCEFCKCYISANKASIEFHENGKNHKENLAKRLTEMQKKAAKEKKDAMKFDCEMKRIEAAALRAYVKDMEFNPDFTSQTIGKIEIPDVPEPAKKSNPAPARHRPPPPPKSTKKWMEAITDDGTSYYWNTETSESVWDPPEEGFMSLQEQKNQKAPKAPKPGGGPSKFKKKFSKKQWKSSGQKRKEGLSHAKEEEKEKPTADFGPIFQGHPYGKWEKVEVVSEEPIDLQLPEQEFVKIVVPSVKEESERKFKEKKIPDAGSIASATGETGFKKRKFLSVPKRNMRQRLDTD